MWLRRDLFRSQRRNGDDEGFAITALLSVADGRAAAMSWWDRCVGFGVVTGSWAR